MPMADARNWCWTPRAAAPDRGVMTTSRYCVVGAGAAGLAAVKVLTEQGFAVDCFERTDRGGGHWHTDYESLHLITSRDVSGFEGHPMPPEFPVYPSRDQMRAYIESFRGPVRPAPARHVRHRGDRGRAGGPGRRAPGTPAATSPWTPPRRA